MYNNPVEEGVESEGSTCYKRNTLITQNPGGYSLFGEVSNSIARGGTVVDTVYNINSIEDCKQLCTDNTNCDGITWERNTSQDLNVH